MLCEMCGREGGRLRKVTIENSVLSVCPGCAKFGDEVIHKTTGGALGPNATVQERLGLRDRRMKTKDVYEKMTLELVDDYPALIKNTRRRLGMTPEDLGKKINEKKSVITKLEHGELRPDNKLIAKLEKTLKISLREEVKEIHVQKHSSGSGMTLGDFIKVEKK